MDGENGGPVRQPSILEHGQNLILIAILLLGSSSQESPLLLMELWDDRQAKPLVDLPSAFRPKRVARGSEEPQRDCRNALAAKRDASRPWRRTEQRQNHGSKFGCDVHTNSEYGTPHAARIEDDLAAY